MPTLRIEAPDGSLRTMDLPDRPVVVGRDPAADIVLDDTQVSHRHLRLRPLGQGEWVARDLSSTRGTLREGSRLLRVLLRRGDVLEIGRHRLVFDPVAVPEGPVVLGGTLALERVPAEGASLSAAGPAPSPAAPSPAPTLAAAVEDLPPAPLDHRAVQRAAVLFAVGALAVAGVLLWLGRPAEQARGRAEELHALRSVLQKLDLGLEPLEMEISSFLDRYPRAPERKALLDYLAGVRAREAERVRREQHLLALTEDQYGLPESEVRGALLDLAAALPGDEDLARQVSLALAGLDRRHEASESAAIAALVTSAQGRIQAGDPAAALRRLSAFRKVWPSLSSETARRLTAVEDEAILALRTLAETAEAQADAAPDDAEARRILARAWRGLEGTPQGDRVADQLRYTRGSLRPRPSGTGPETRPPTEPAVPDEEPAILARAAAAEDLARARHWAQAMAAFEALVGESRPGLLNAEWRARAREMGQVLALVDRLAAAASGEKPPRVRLSGGKKATVAAADREGVTLEDGEMPGRLDWGAVAEDDLLALLTPPDPQPRERLGLAVLAASLGRRVGVVQALAPLIERGEEAAAAADLAARYLFGRPSPPPEGYRVHEGEILDREGYERRMRAVRIAAVREVAAKALARLEKEAPFKKLEKLREMRATLDERRLYALLAIFNETHYPYPANKASQAYQAVQKEIDRRVQLAREIWDDPYKVRIERKGTLGRALEDWDTAIAELRRLEDDVADLEARVAPFVTYVTGEPISIREFWVDDAERQRLAYDRWVMGIGNLAQTAEATEAERHQTQVTNEYRMLMGYAVIVKPGPALFDAIDDENVGKVLDQGRIEGRPTPLLAVRIDDRLVRAARGHSLDMQRRGFFSHHAPPNPATGDAGTSPFDRIQKAGYTGGGASENIANGASSAEQAHQMWVHSSGHHRNILSPWTDQGVGVAGRLWTQNYGVGGGWPPVIPEEDAGTAPGAAPGAAAPGAGGEAPGRR